MKDFKIRSKEITGNLTDFISKQVRLKGFRRALLGFSGGLDSTIVAYLSKKALGSDNVIGIIMPYRNLSKRSTQDAKRIAKLLKIKTECIDISPMVDAYFSKAKNSDNIRRGNKMARERMSILYDLSKKYNGLVIGTSNKTEISLGYGTIHGDSACAINPIGNLYKTQLKFIARYLGVPSYILNKTPSAGLWDRQTDEQELGYLYKDIDRLLFFIVDKRLGNKELLKKKFDRKFILDIRKRIRDNRFKSQLPIIAKWD